MLKFIISSFCCYILLAGDVLAQHLTPQAEELAQLMIGDFSSAEQAKADTAFFDVRLHVRRIWQERTDAVWLYVEQALGQAQERPYRQRIYKVVHIQENTFESIVFTLPDAKKVIGGWKNTFDWSAFSPQILEERTGCTVYLTKVTDNTYTGATKENTCASDLRGATYATSEVRISPEGMVSWDRGYAADGKQVWGAEKGGYDFKRER